MILRTETSATETTAPDLDAVVNEIYQATQAEAKIESAEQALHQFRAGLRDSHLRFGGMTDDEIRTMKDEIDAIRLRLQKAACTAGDRARIAHKERSGAAMRHALHRLQQG